MYPFLSGVAGFGGFLLRGDSDMIGGFCHCFPPRPSSPLFLQLINKLWGFFNLWRAGAWCLGWGLNSFTSARGQHSRPWTSCRLHHWGRHPGSHGHPWKGRPARGTPSRESSHLPLPRRASADLGQPGAGAFKCFRGNQLLSQPPDLTKTHWLLQPRRDCR